MNESLYTKVRHDLIEAFPLNIFTSDHGVGHWADVESNALKIAKIDQRVDVDVLRWFSLLHDCRRMTEIEDAYHGRRAVDVLLMLGAETLSLSDYQFYQLLLPAIEHHADGELSDDVSIGACWDADRLDLGRVGILPDPKYMSTAAGKMIAEKVSAKLKEEWEFNRQSRWLKLGIH